MTVETIQKSPPGMVHAGTMKIPGEVVRNLIDPYVPGDMYEQEVPLPDGKTAYVRFDPQTAFALAGALINMAAPYLAAYRRPARFNIIVETMDATGLPRSLSFTPENATLQAEKLLAFARKKLVINK